MDDVQKQGAVFSPEGLMMLSIFGVLDIIDFFIGSVLVVDILASLVYFVWVHFRSQGERAVSAGQAREEIKERRAERGKKLQERKEKTKAKKTTGVKKGKWLRRSLLLLEWIPIIGMIPGWVLMVYSELKS